MHGILPDSPQWSNTRSIIMNQAWFNFGNSRPKPAMNHHFIHGIVHDSPQSSNTRSIVTQAWFNFGDGRPKPDLNRHFIRFQLHCLKFKALHLTSMDVWEETSGTSADVPGFGLEKKGKME